MIWTINGYCLEFYEDDHIYLVDGKIVPSVSEILSARFGGKYNHVPDEVLQKAAERGREVHAAIEAACLGLDTDIQEVRNFRFLQKHYCFEPVRCERPVILFDNGEPVAAGRFDLEIEMGGVLGGADVKTTSTLDRDYLYYQLNLYRVANKQSYGVEWAFLRALHLRGDTRKFVPIPISDSAAWEIYNLWRDTKDE